MRESRKGMVSRMGPGAADLMKPFVIEDARLADLPAVIALDAQITGVEKPDYWHGYYASPGKSERRSFLVARLAGQVVGFVAGEVRAWEFGAPPCGWLITIGVRPEYRLARIGTSLFERLVARFADIGVERIRTVLDIDDHLLMSFFRSHGMTPGPFLPLEMAIAR